MKPRGALLAAVFVAMGSLVGACDDSTSGSAATSSPHGAAAQAAKKPLAPKAKAVAKKALELAERDFTESDTNRDPFRSYLGEFLTPRKRTAKIQRKVLLRAYGLDELQLIAVVAGGTRARAMFRDPAGLGVAVKRGDYLGKSAGKVKQILPGKVIVQIQEQGDDGQVVADRVIDLHPSVVGGGDQ